MSIDDELPEMPADSGCNETIDEPMVVTLILLKDSHHVVSFWIMHSAEATAEGDNETSSSQQAGVYDLLDVVLHKVRELD